MPLCVDTIMIEAAPPIVLFDGWEARICGLRSGHPPFELREGGAASFVVAHAGGPSVAQRISFQEFIRKNVLIARDLGFVNALFFHLWARGVMAAQHSVKVAGAGSSPAGSMPRFHWKGVLW
jgi:hypothetical protein